MSLINLPEELYESIFKNLNLKQLIRLREICKWFKYLIDNYYVKELAILKNSNKLGNKWYYLNEKINLNYVIELNLAKKKIFEDVFMNGILKFDLFKNIKLLRLEYKIRDHNYDLTFDCLEKFPKLEQFEVFFYYVADYYDFEIIIKHPNLKIILIDSTDMKFIFNCPNLEILCYDLDDSDVLSEINYEKIKHLSNINSHKITNTNLQRFINLEFIKFVNVDRINLNFLFEFTKLKVVDFGRSIDNLMLKQFFLNKKRLKKYDLIVKYNGKEFYIEE